MKRNTAWALLLVILLGAFFLRQYRLLDFPYHGDEVDEGDIALDILHGHLAPFYAQNEGNEALYQFVLVPFFAVLGAFMFGLGMLARAVARRVLSPRAT